MLTKRCLQEARVPCARRRAQNVICCGDARPRLNVPAGENTAGTHKVVSRPVGRQSAASRDGGGQYLRAPHSHSLSFPRTPPLPAISPYSRLPALPLHRGSPSSLPSSYSGGSAPCPPARHHPMCCTYHQCSRVVVPNRLASSLSSFQSAQFVHVPAEQ